MRPGITSYIVTSVHAALYLTSRRFCNMLLAPFVRFGIDVQRTELRLIRANRRFQIHSSHAVSLGTPQSALEDSEVGDGCSGVKLINCRASESYSPLRLSRILVDRTRPRLGVLVLRCVGHRFTPMQRTHNVRLVSRSGRVHFW